MGGDPGEAGDGLSRGDVARTRGERGGCTCRTEASGCAGGRKAAEVLGGPQCPPGTGQRVPGRTPPEAGRHQGKDDKKQGQDRACPQLMAWALAQTERE